MFGSSSIACYLYRITDHAWLLDRSAKPDFLYRYSDTERVQFGASESDPVHHQPRHPGLYRRSAQSEYLLGQSHHRWLLCRASFGVHLRCRTDNAWMHDVGAYPDLLHRHSDAEWVRFGVAESGPVRHLPGHLGLYRRSAKPECLHE